MPVVHTVLVQVPGEGEGHGLPAALGGAGDRPEPRALDVRLHVTSRQLRNII